MAANIEKLDKSIDSFESVTSQVNGILKELNEKISDSKSIIEELSDINGKVDANKQEMETLIKEDTQSLHDNIDDLRNNFTKISEDNKNEIVRMTQENINYSKNETIDRINDGKNQINDAISLFKSNNEIKQSEILKSATNKIDDTEHTITKCIANNKDELLTNLEKNTEAILDQNNNSKKEILEKIIEALELIEESKKTLDDNMFNYRNSIENLIEQKNKTINNRMDKRDKIDLIFFISSMFVTTAILVVLIVFFAKMV